MDDIELFASLAGAGGYAAEMAERIRSRRIFKRAVYVGLECLDPSILRINEKILCSEIAHEAGVEADYILLDNPALPDAQEGSFPALVEGEVRPLREVSPLVSILERAHKATWRFGVYCRAEDREAVAQAARRALNLKKNKLIYKYINSF
jgi:uncharacterized protein